MKRVTSLLIVLLLWLSSATYAQQGTVELGAGTASNGTTSSPTPYGTYYKNLRQQYLVLASELSGIGLVAGDISAIGFNVANVNTCSSMPNYTMQIKATTASVLTTTFDNEGYTVVWAIRISCRLTVGTHTLLMRHFIGMAHLTCSWMYASTSSQEAIVKMLLCITHPQRAICRYTIEATHNLLAAQPMRVHCH